MFDEVVEDKQEVGITAHECAYYVLVHGVV